MSARNWKREREARLCARLRYLEVPVTEKGTPSETPRIEHLPSGLAMLCRPNGGCRPATKEELFFDSENSRLRDELAETERKYLDAWRESQIERAAAVAAEARAGEYVSALPASQFIAPTDVAAESPDHTCHWHDHFVAEAVKCLATERELEKKTAALREAANIVTRLAAMMENGAGELEPGGRLRQAERAIRALQPEDKHE